MVGIELLSFLPSNFLGLQRYLKEDSFQRAVSKNFVGNQPNFRLLSASPPTVRPVALSPHLRGLPRLELCSSTPKAQNRWLEGGPPSARLPGSATIVLMGSTHLGHAKRQTLITTYVCTRMDPAQWSPHRDHPVLPGCRRHRRKLRH